MAEPNGRLRTRREAMPSRRVPGECLGRSELAETVNEYLWETTKKRYELDGHSIARYERGEVLWPSAPYRSALRAVLGASADIDLGFRPTRRGNTGVAATHRVVQASCIPVSNTGEGDEGDDSVKRRNFLVTAGPTLSSGLMGAQLSEGNIVSSHEATEWFAWHLWQLRARELHRSQIPVPVARCLDAHPHVIRQPDGLYRFTDPALIDVLVARRVFGDIVAGSGHLLATAQTSHATDLTIGSLTAHNGAARWGLGVWARRGATAVIRVNAAGILAKVGDPDLGDAAISAIRADQDARHLYLTAVASRVLALPWEQAGHLAATVGTQDTGITHTPNGPEMYAAESLVAELVNPRDAAARWCSTVLLHRLANPVPEMVRAALARAVQHEPCRENLRAHAAALAGASPVNS